MNLKYKLIVFCFLFFTLGCSEEFLTVENQNELSDSSFYKTADDFEDLILTCYTPFGTVQNLTAQHVIGFSADDRVLHEQVNRSLLQYTSIDETVRVMYKGLFYGVFRSNLFLEKFTDDIEMEEERRKTILGEAYFFRAFHYYFLATWFEVPPLLLETAKDPSVGHPNATQEEVYAQVEKDFLKAIELLPDHWDGSQLGRATKGAAKAFLGKTFLIQSKFEKAASILGEIVNSNVYALNMPMGTDSLDYIYAYLSNFTSIDMPHNGNLYKSEFNSESIYEVNYSTAYLEQEYLVLRRTSGGHITWFNGPQTLTNGYANIAAEDKVFPLEFEKTPNHPAGLTKDPRYYGFYIEVGDQLDPRPDHPLHNQYFREVDLNPSMGSKKGLRKGLWPYHTTYSYSKAPFQDPNNWRLMRYSEVLLMYAEAKVRSTGNFSDASALGALNEVRNRAGLVPLNVLSKEAIIHERDIELAGEHKRFWDFSRWYTDGWMTLEEIQEFKPTYQPRHVCYPIPLSEINRHYGVLKQNPKWL